VEYFLKARVVFDTGVARKAESEMPFQRPNM